MPSHLETLLTSVGVPAEDITAIQALKDTDAFDPKPIAEKVKGNFRTQFQNDPSFFEGITEDKLPAATKKKLEADQFGRATGIVKQKFSKLLGLTDADLAALTDEQKEKYEAYIPAVAEVWTKLKSGDKVTQEQLIAARRELEELKTTSASAEETIKTKYQSESDAKVNTALFNAALLGELAQLEGLKISASDIAATANSVLLSKYAFERVGDYGIELRRKDNPKMKVLKDNSSKEVTLKDALNDIAVERGWIEKEEGGTGKTGGGKVKITPAGGVLKMPPHLQAAINNKIASEGK
jgi:hypothetical protein